MANRVPPPREFSWARTLRTLSFWALLIVGSIFLVQFASNRRQEAVDLSYTPQFTEQLDKGNVAAVEITDRAQVKGDFRTAVTVGRHTAEHFTMLLPFESTDAWDYPAAEGRGRAGARREAVLRRVSLQLSAVPVHHRPADFHGAADAAGGKPRVRVRQVESEALGGRHSQGHVRRCGRRRRGEAGARGDHRFPQGPAEVPAAGRAAPQGGAAGRSAGNGEDAARQGGGGRGGAAVLLDVGLGLRRDVRGRRRVARARPVRAGEGPRAVHHLHR